MTSNVSASFFPLSHHLIPHLMCFEPVASHLIACDGGHCHCRQSASSALRLRFLHSRWRRSSTSTSSRGRGVRCRRSDLQLRFWAAHCSLPPLILSPFITVQCFQGHFLQAYSVLHSMSRYFLGALQPLAVAVGTV